MNTFKVRRTLTANTPPPVSGSVGALAEGELGIELAGAAPKLWVGCPVALDPTGRRLVIDASTIPGTGPGEGFLPLAGGTLGSATATNGQGLLTLRSAATPSFPQIGFAIAAAAPIWYAGTAESAGASAFRIYSAPEGVGTPGLYLGVNNVAYWTGRMQMGAATYLAGAANAILTVQAADHADIHFIYGNDLVHWTVGSAPAGHLQFISEDSGAWNGMWLDNEGNLNIGGAIDAGTW